MDARASAWSAVHEALPARWRVAAPPSVSDPSRRTWTVTAVGPHPGRGRTPQTVTGTGPDETTALQDLDDKLRGIDHSKGTRLEELRQRLRLAYVEGAEGWARKNLGRGLTGDELRRVASRFEPPP